MIKKLLLFGLGFLFAFIVSDFVTSDIRKPYLYDTYEW